MKKNFQLVNKSFSVLDASTRCASLLGTINHEEVSPVCLLYLSTEARSRKVPKDCITMDTLCQCLDARRNVQLLIDGLIIKVILNGAIHYGGHWNWQTLCHADASLTRHLSWNAHRLLLIIPKVCTHTIINKDEICEIIKAYFYLFFRKKCMTSSIKNYQW